MSHILIIDDDIHINEMLEEVLIQEGIRDTALEGEIKKRRLRPRISPFIGGIAVVQSSDF